MADLSERIDEAARAPATVEFDSRKVTEHKLSDLVLADSYLAKKTVTARSTGGMRLAKMVPPGAS